MTLRATVRQIDIERAIKAARKVGAGRVVVRHGEIEIEIEPAQEEKPVIPAINSAPDEGERQTVIPL